MAKRRRRHSKRYSGFGDFLSGLSDSVTVHTGMSGTTKLVLAGGAVWLYLRHKKKAEAIAAAALAAAATNTAPASDAVVAQSTADSAKLDAAAATGTAIPPMVVTPGGNVSSGILIAASDVSGPQITKDDVNQTPPTRAQSPEWFS